MKSNRYIETLRHTSLPFPDLYSKLFDGVVATGNASWRPTSATVYKPRFDPLNLDCNIEEFDMPNVRQASPPPCSSRPRAEKNKTKGKEEVNEKIISVLQSLADKHVGTEKYTFTDCKNKLDALDWESTIRCMLFPLLLLSRSLDGNGSRLSRELGDDDWP